MSWRAGAAGLAIVAIMGCGGGHHKAGTPRPTPTQPASNDRGAREGGQGAGEQDKGGLTALPLEDRRSFLQLGAASSNLRSAASLMLVKGFAPPRERSTLLRLRKSVALLKPRDPRLRRLRVETLAALTRGLRAPRAARAMLADANRIQQGLKQYSKAQPAIGTIAPD